MISYAAALSGAVVVFLVSRRYLRDGMARLLARTAALQRVVRAVEKRPRLLLLIRVAPYPYNLLNVLLAASHTLRFSTYFACTALSLVKVLIHTSVGSSIHSFAGYHAAVPGGAGGEQGPQGAHGPQGPQGAHGTHGAQGEPRLGKAWTAIGVLLALAILVYLSFVARQAVDEELGDEDVARAEEGAAEMRLVDS